VEIDDEEDFEVGTDFRAWARLLGRWDLQDGSALYAPEDDKEPAVGTILSPVELREGVLSVTTRFVSGEEVLPQARIIFGWDSHTKQHYSAGLGGYNAMYSIEAFSVSPAASGYTPVLTFGEAANLNRDEDYEITVMIAGSMVRLVVDGVTVTDAELPIPLRGPQTGLVARGISPIQFKDFIATLQTPTAFVVMKFDEPYNTLYEEVISPVCVGEGFKAVRADEFSGPGIIIEDIVQSIRDASVVIAEITPVNANVFYELGYAHATAKPTILLAERGQTLPFDVSGWRCVFYDNTIGGKSHVEDELRRHLQAVARR
jgi:hypothetical protein